MLYIFVSQFQSNSELTSENVNSIEVGKFSCTRDAHVTLNRPYPSQKNHKTSRYINISWVHNYFSVVFESKVIMKDKEKRPFHFKILNSYQSTRLKKMK